jgi:LPXTG-site transpeptidase (sortase) family protein
MLIDGHISSWTAHGVFYGLNTLKPGDQMKIERGDGTIFTYSVVTTKIFSANNVNMQSAITPINSAKPGLNLISCSGDVIPGTSEFNERIIVYGSLIN